MKGFVAVLGCSAIFGFAVAIGYWFVSHDYTGTVLLGIMGIALAFASTWALIAERDAHLPGDEPAEATAKFAGEEVGIFTGASAWPPLVALCSLAFVVGIIWIPLVAIAAVIGLLLCFWRLGAESNRV